MLNVLSKKLNTAWIIVALIGFIDATYLTVVHFQGSDLGCSIVSGCNQVLASEHSSIGSVPLALFGVLYYLLMLLGFIFVLDRKSETVLEILAYLSTAGFLMSGWLFFVQWKIVEAFCQYCLLSALTSTLLFIFGMIILRKINYHNNQAEERN